MPFALSERMAEPVSDKGSSDVLTRAVRPWERIEFGDEIWWWDCRRGVAGWRPVDAALIGELTEYRRVRRLRLRLVQ